MFDGLKSWYNACVYLAELETKEEQALKMFEKLQDPVLIERWQKMLNKIAVKKTILKQHTRGENNAIRRR